MPMLRGSVPACGACLLGLVLAGPAHAQSVEIAPFVGYGFGGSVVSIGYGTSSAVDAGVVYGGIVDVTIAKAWRLEALYSRQESAVATPGAAGRIGLRVERYLAGIQEEKAWGRVRAFGVGLVGATRFVPAGYDSETYFTAGVALGVKSRLAGHFGARLEGRLFYVPVTTGGGAVCSGGQCLFGYSGSGMFQGDVSAALVIGF